MVDEQIKMMSHLLDNSLVWRGSKPRERDYFNYYPSGIGKCLRKQQYERFVFLGLLKKPLKDLNARSQRIFDTGNSMHERWAQYFEDMNVLRGCWKCANPLCKCFKDSGEFDQSIPVEKIREYLATPIMSLPTRVYGEDNVIGDFRPKSCTCGSVNFIYQESVAEDKNLKYRGRMDLILDFTHFDNYFVNDMTYNLNIDVLPKPGEIIIADMKSCKDSVYIRNVAKGDGHPEYRAQVISYIHMIPQAKYGLLIYENKDNSETKWIKIPKNEQWWSTIKWQLEQLNHAIVTDDDGKVVSTCLPPPKPKSKGSFDCKFCEYSSICHSSKIWDSPDLESKRKMFYKELLY